ncbi:hypothetical protein [Palleronia caenipelagi]|uniref:Uncharacterized protein n=1 Tax=Palleronia caenipelagi TaxID=2489174 RepID=A0A547PRB2_9RHOB|nr:hypothetical protein [Palleronia caenipelagi]TRD16687.1 hypothetical protein FEV53_13880 [Palleronia caenipelagi]
MRKLGMMLVATVSLSGCVLPQLEEEDPTLLKNISPEALAALPQGVDPHFLIRDANGCYGLALEAVPEEQVLTGIALLDANGQQICDAPT